MTNLPPTGGQQAWGTPQNDPQPQPAPGYGAPGPSYGGPQGGQGQPSNGLGIAALVVGIVALLLSVLFFPVGLVLGIVALVLGIVGLRKANRGEATNKGMAIAGITTGAIAIVIAGLLAAFIGTFLFQNKDEIGNLTDCIQQADTPQEQADCQVEFNQNFGN